MIAQLDDAKYAAVLDRYKPRPTHTDEDNQRAIDVVEGLRTDGALTAEQEALAEVLTTLIERFEERHVLNPAPRAAILRDLLEANGLKQSDLARLVGSKGIASEIINGKRGISRSLAQIFAKRFNVPHRLFL
jgi:HTH-type transcriptional regulator/antitoxin HigA